jgi:hypothetical protein
MTKNQNEYCHIVKHSPFPAGWSPSAKSGSFDPNVGCTRVCFVIVVSFVGRIMVFLSSVVLGFITKPLTMIRLFAELFGHYPLVIRSRAGATHGLRWIFKNSSRAFDPYGLSAAPSPTPMEGKYLNCLPAR